MEESLLLVLRAAGFAADKHRDQRRKDVTATPYVNHPLAVANLLAGAGGVTDSELLAAALLHDTIEDTETTRDELREIFGERVTSLVEEVTDDKSLPKSRRKSLQIENAPRKSDGAKQLKIADKICNVRDLDGDSPAEWSRERKLEYLDWAVAVIAGCRGVNLDLDHLFDETIADAQSRLGG